MTMTAETGPATPATPQPGSSRAACRRSICCTAACGKRRVGVQEGSSRGWQKGKQRSSQETLFPRRRRRRRRPRLWPAACPLLRPALYTHTHTHSLGVHLCCCPTKAYAHACSYTRSGLATPSGAPRLKGPSAMTCIRRRPGSSGVRVQPTELLLGHVSMDITPYHYPTSH